MNSGDLLAPPSWWAKAGGVNARNHLLSLCWVQQLVTSTWEAEQEEGKWKAAGHGSNGQDSNHGRSVREEIRDVSSKRWNGLLGIICKCPSANQHHNGCVCLSKRWRDGSITYWWKSIFHWVQQSGCIYKRCRESWLGNACLYAPWSHFHSPKSRYTYWCLERNTEVGRAGFIAGSGWEDIGAASRMLPASPGVILAGGINPPPL